MTSAAAGGIKRAAGVLLHPSSLPGPDGIGDLGPGATRWLGWLKTSGCTIWQILPLGPVGFGYSPYQNLSAFAGNPLLISLERLVEDGLLPREALEDRPDFSSEYVDYKQVQNHKQRMLAHAHAAFLRGEGAHLQQAYDQFCKSQAEWLEEYVLFMALKDAYQQKPWMEWEAGLALRNPSALKHSRRKLSDRLAGYRFQQFLFFHQWALVREQAHTAGIRLIGDIPIFVAQDSADVWSRPELFHLDRDGNPTVVSGVPPDFFSQEGQLWGNPLYRWERMEGNGFSWWLKRIKATLNLVDFVRMDHFRGFESYWEIPAGAPNAVEGRWVKAPGEALFSTIERELGGLSLIAEDLGLITPEVHALRDRFQLPGMKVLQFAFGGDPEHVFLPHTYPENCVVYTGTHDNNTSIGWYQAAPETERDFCRRYLAVDGSDIAWDLIRAAGASRAVLSIAPLQDLLSLGSEARMNLPGTAHGNWRWRLPVESLTPAIASRFRELNVRHQRLPVEHEGLES